MSEVETGAQSAQPQSLTIREAAQRFAETGRNESNPVSEAARTLGQRAREARQERQAQARQAQESVEETEGSNAQDDQIQPEETLDENVADEPSIDPEAAQEAEPEEAQTIDLGDGLKVTLDEVRDGFMLKADHTRKTQALADERRAFEADRQQRVAVFDTLTEALKQRLGPVKSMKQWLAEDPIEGLQKFADQQELVGAISASLQTREAENAHHINQLKANTIKSLAEKHGDKAETVFSSAVQYAASKTGLDASYVASLISHPEAIAMVNDAKAYRELQANKGKVTRLVANKPTLVKVGAKVSAQASRQSAVQSASAKLNSSGKIKDAVALLRAQRQARGG